MGRDALDVEDLATLLPPIFEQAQASVASHKKNCVALYKIHNAAGKLVERSEGKRGIKSGEVRLVGEKEFSEVILDMVNRVLVIRKSVPAADRIIKFMGSYVRYALEKDGGEDETPTSRFVQRLLKHLTKGFEAKSKDVRCRCLAFTSEIVSNLGEMDSDMYATLKSALLTRLADKEPLARTFAVAALSKLAASEDPTAPDSDSDEESEPILPSLVFHLVSDPDSSVRRAALVHMPFLPTTLSPLLTRMRDPDPLVRKLVYSAVLSRLDHPRLLTIGQRESVARYGLGDRIESVRAAAANLLGKWLDVVSTEGEFEEFVKLFDVINGPDIARDVLKSVFLTRKTHADDIEFDDAFWAGQKLSPEKALIASAFVEHCIESEDSKELEETLPVVTALAFSMQATFNNLLDHIQGQRSRKGVANLDGNDEDEDDSDEAQTTALAFTLAQLLRIALHADYADEIGRRKMFDVVRSMLSHPSLPDSRSDSEITTNRGTHATSGNNGTGGSDGEQGLVELCVKVLSVMSVSERDLVRVVVECVTEMRDGVGLGGEESMDESPGISSDIDDTQSQVSTARPTGFTRSGRSRSRRKDYEDLTPEERLEADMVDLRCLSVTIAALRLVHGSFEENSSLEGILTELVVPSVKRKEIFLRERGLTALGLCCLIAKNLALNSFQLFFSQVKSSPEVLRLRSLHAIFDIIMTYEKDLIFGPEPIGEKVTAFLMQVLETEESPAVQALIVVGLSKLMLFGLCTDERVLMCLVIAYISPMTRGNEPLRQCLAYFLPLYCFTNAENQRRMLSVFLRTYDLARSVYDDLDDEEGDKLGAMITPLQLGQLLVDWTDPSKLVNASQQQQNEDPLPVHVELAVEILKALFDNEREPEDRKNLVQLLSKLLFPKSAPQVLLNTLYLLILYLPEISPLDAETADAATERLFKRFKIRVESQFRTDLEAFDEKACFEEADGQVYGEIFEFMGVKRPKNRRYEGRVGAVPEGQATEEKKGDEKSDVEMDTETETEDHTPAPSSQKRRRQHNGRARSESIDY